ncbi:MAG: DEAD/DEAH box helicase [Polyangiaceae bacterium]|nr:DEAD/DEAH box helicase [Polyangiaceae bacterium]
MTFDELPLIASLRAAVAAVGYQRATPIQAQAIPPALAGRDVLGCAQTGTGKTAAFALPILQHIDRVAGRGPRLRALVVTPTRELAAQIGQSLAVYGRDLTFWHTVVFGGVHERPQIAELERGVDVLVATPGRLLDLLERGFVRLDDVEVFVLDEADRMLDMGFIHDVRRITRALPPARQTLFFSATMPVEIRELADGLLHDPVYVAVTPPATAADHIEQRIYFTEKARKPGLLVDLLKSTDAQRTLVFSRTKHGANRVVKYLERDGIHANAIHGNKSQAARVRALEGFRRGEFPVLVATDIAARGLDVSGITHVINYDLPNEPETYVHRIGRTARAGASGVALSLCDPEEREHLAGIERLLGRRLERSASEPVGSRKPLRRDAQTIHLASAAREPPPSSTVLRPLDASFPAPVRDRRGGPRTRPSRHAALR